MLREDIKGLQQASPRDLRKFGLMVGGVFLALGIYFYLRHKPWWLWFVAPGAPLFLLGSVFPRSLKWIYVAWMSMAIVISLVLPSTEGVTKNPSDRMKTSSAPVARPGIVSGK